MRYARRFPNTLAARPTAGNLPSATLVLAATLALAASVVVGEEAENNDHGLRNAKFPEPNLVFGGQPTEEQLEAMAEDGLAFVLDLRTEGEDRGFDEPVALRRLDVPYLNLPVDGDRLTQPDTFERFIEAMQRAEEADGPVLVHCASGNRVGAMYYAYLVAARGVDQEEARVRARANGLGNRALEGAVDRYLDSSPDE